ncbi:dTDP-4-dehydrorhamnose 3,5-epimerase [Candidatus Methylopumilus rimovensis]|uniref:dTDP-4-dehydrorhamnose 3,5-epimerase n=1 Tax=Candidatus Methylopumilus rimovensis TaxID=2588535 RepID=A0AAE6FSG3_9PROT|nr:dTDP-4-dehydrorhamnose 3,5-epimerase family protein [Candidatus Methylopumilus rimovensis]QDD13377.1 dTDP-4-dehydrorhamnose 3,5-epimerase [Candidatus Methylopumilus rimovensis]
MIDGVVLTPLRQIFDERGKVMHMLRSDSPIFLKFGEIYFSCTHPGVVKAWHRHKEMTLNYAVIFGEIKFVLYDDRIGSPSQGEIQEFFISPENYMLVTVPPMVWNGFKSVGTQTSIVANCANIPHTPSEIERLLPTDLKVPYDWALQNR